MVGGSGIYAIEGLRNARWRTVESPFGEPSDALLHGELDGQELVFLPRHGRGHRIGPSEINYRANIDALKRVGVTDIVSLSAVGSLREDLSPGTFVIVDQFIDNTVTRQRSFFGAGIVAHVSLAQPVCNGLGSSLASAATGIDLIRGGTYIAVEGPQFSTRAESDGYRDGRGDVIGMTNMPEARLAREAEICYATVAMVTDYDCWHPGHDAVSVENVVAVLSKNADKARTLIRRAARPIVVREDHCACRTALDNAVITPPDARDRDLVVRLDAVAGRVLRN